MSQNGKPCVCDGMYEGCGHERFCGAVVTDDRWGPWCAECNPRRLAHLDSQFAALTAVLDKPGGAA